MIGLLLAMYPAQWRRRYGEEFRAVLESRPLGPFDVADVVLGALDARSRVLRIASLAEKTGGRFTMLRIGGIGAIFGGVLWDVGFIGSSSVSEPDTPGWLVIMAIGTIGLLLALVGLSAFQAHRNPRLAWAALLIPVVGSIVSVTGLVGTLSGASDSPMLAGWSAWGIWILGLFGMVIGSILFGVATIRAAVLSRHAAISLACSSGGFLLVGMLGIAGETGEQLSAQLILAAVIVAFGASWVWLGASALRRGPIRAIQTA